MHATGYVDSRGARERFSRGKKELYNLKGIKTKDYVRRKERKGGDKTISDFQFFERNFFIFLG